MPLLHASISVATGLLPTHPIPQHVIIKRFPSLKPDPLLRVFIRQEQSVIISWKQNMTKRLHFSAVNKTVSSDRRFGHNYFRSIYFILLKSVYNTLNSGVRMSAWRKQWVSGLIACHSVHKTWQLMITWKQPSSSILYLLYIKGWVLLMSLGLYSLNKLNSLDTSKNPVYLWYITFRKWNSSKTCQH